MIIERFSVGRFDEVFTPCFVAKNGLHSWQLEKLGVGSTRRIKLNYVTEWFDRDNVKYKGATLVIRRVGGGGGVTWKVVSADLRFSHSEVTSLGYHEAQERFAGPSFLDLSERRVP